MALHDEILREILSGRVPFRFKIRDLKRTPGKVAGRYMVGRGEYSEKAIKTIPRNHSVRPDGSEPGDYVQKGKEPAFLWYGGGEFELVLDHSHYLQDVTPEDEEFGPRSLLGIDSDFVWKKDQSWLGHGRKRKA